MMSLVDKKGEHGGPRPKGRQPKRTTPGTRSLGVSSDPKVPFTHMYLVISRAKPVAIHCDPVSEELKPPLYSETRWIAASLALLFPRNDNT